MGLAGAFRGGDGQRSDLVLTDEPVTRSGDGNYPSITLSLPDPILGRERQSRNNDPVPAPVKTELFCPDQQDATPA